MFLQGGMETLLKKKVDGRRFPVQVSIFHQDGLAVYVYIICIYRCFSYACVRMHIVIICIYIYTTYIIYITGVCSLEVGPLIVYRLVYKPPFFKVRV